MTAREVAARLGVTRSRVHALRRDGQLAGTKRLAETGVWYWAFPRHAVEHLAEERRRVACGELPARGGNRPRTPPERSEENG